MKTIRLHITGKVQGVWFRASTKDAAIRLGLTGRVWNNADDSVGVLAQGPDPQIQTFIEWCRQGPPLARVEHVTITEVMEEWNDASFEIVKEG